MVEESDQRVKVLVGQRVGETFRGFWAVFEGEEVSSYKDTRAEKHIVDTLCRCTAFSYEAYRVHIADESKPEAPVYELLPFERRACSSTLKPRSSLARRYVLGLS